MAGPGHRAGVTDPGHGHAGRTKVGADARIVKAWARANGYQVRERGRVPNEVVAAFEAAN